MMHLMVMGVMYVDLCNPIWFHHTLRRFDTCFAREELGWNIEKPYTQKQVGKAGT